MQRRWQVHPDENGMVSREALISAFIDAAALLDIAGGTLSVVTGRAPTDLPGEMFTTGAVFEWRDRTDAKAQPEAPSTVTTKYESAEEFVKSEEGRAAVDGALAEAESLREAGSPDGFDYSGLPDEDVEEATEAAR